MCGERPVEQRHQRHQPRSRRDHERRDEEDRPRSRDAAGSARPRSTATAGRRRARPTTTIARTGACAWPVRAGGRRRRGPCARAAIPEHRCRRRCGSSRARGAPWRSADRLGGPGGHAIGGHRIRHPAVTCDQTVGPDRGTAAPGRRSQRGAARYAPADGSHEETPDRAPTTAGRGRPVARPPAWRPATVGRRRGRIRRCPASRQTIYQYERGGLTPSLAQFLDLVGVLRAARAPPATGPRRRRISGRRASRR